MSNTLKSFPVTYLFDPLPESGRGKRCLFIAENVSTKWVKLFILESATSEKNYTTQINIRQWY